MKNNVTEQLSVSRAALAEILVVGFLLGVCASLSGTLLYEKLKEHLSWIYLGLAVLIVWCIYVLSKKFKRLGKANVFVQGFLVHLEKDNQIQCVPRYRFSEEIFRYLNSAFKENEALKRQWDKEPLQHVLSRKQGESASGSLKLIREAVEYYLIEKLSRHLADYFNREKYDKSLLSELSREDVPSILLSNRFMELFSAPMENRAVFEPHDRDCDGVIVMSMGSNGALYSRFDLVLPKGAKVSRNNGSVVIETSKFKLKISVTFNGLNFVSPRDFEEYYLGLKPSSSYSEFVVEFKAEVEFNLLNSLRRSGWDYHAWLDSYFECIERDMSSENFFKEINWETVATMIHCGQKMPKGTGGQKG